MVPMDVTVGSRDWKDAIWLVTVFIKYGRFEEKEGGLRYIETLKK
jgi:hypothetical protein